MNLRYSIDPADTDGGMAAAAIEQDAEGSEQWLEARYTAAIEAVGGHKAGPLDPVTIWMMGAAWGRDHAEQPRPLTPDDITHEMVKRANAALMEKAGGRYYYSTIKAVLAAALTEPPTRPKWADIEDVLNAGWPEGINGAENGYIARMLHHGGIRVTRADS